MNGLDGGGLPREVPPALRPFVDAGILASADVHVARLLCRLAGDPADEAVLGAALAVRAPRLGHVCVDLERVAGGAEDESGAAAAAPPWPEPDAWRRALGAWAAVDSGDDPDRPLRLRGNLLYLHRLHADEAAVADALLGRAGAPKRPVDDGLRDLADRLFPGPTADDQRAAALTVARRAFTVIAGGPGTGKTTTVARTLALLDAMSPLRPGLTALAAPTGKAAARLGEAVREEAASLDVDAAARARLEALGGTTLHRLLGRRPDSGSRFRHDGGNRLPHRLVIVDETSMVSLALMARLLEALRDDARLVLVGDPEQLVSVEAGSVLGDIVGPVRTAGAGAPAGSGPLAPGVAMLRRSHRFGGAITDLADAVRRGDASAAVRVLAAGADGVTWVQGDAADAGAQAELRDRAVTAGRRVLGSASSGRAVEALDALAGFRILVAHRRGPHGVERWNELVEGWLARDGATPGLWYPGRPVMVTANDHALRLYNGDVGVVVARDGEPAAVAFARDGDAVAVAPERLGDIAPVHAMTIHKSQGSQFEGVAVVVPPADSPILTRELLYTAVTRARTRLLVIGTAEAVRAAVERPVVRASGLGHALWTEQRPPAPPLDMAGPG